jgi:hypothetical protein
LAIGLYLYFLGLSYRSTAKAYQRDLSKKEGDHIPIWKWIQKYRPEKISYKGARGRRIPELIVDKTQIKVVNDYFFWIWIAIKPKDRSILLMFIFPQQKEPCLLQSTFSSESNKQMWKTPDFNRRWYLISVCL